MYACTHADTHKHTSVIQTSPCQSTQWLQTYEQVGKENMSFLQVVPVFMNLTERECFVTSVLKGFLFVFVCNTTHLLPFHSQLKKQICYNHEGNHGPVELIGDVVSNMVLSSGISKTIFNHL